MSVRAYLYDAEGRDQEVELTAGLLASIERQQLLWIDVDATDHRRLGELAQLLELDPASLRQIECRRVSRLRSLLAGQRSVFFALSRPAAVAGVFGMNFETASFGTGDTGFYTTIIALFAAIVASTLSARWRGWI